jgi:biopolymer transport protein TolQ
MSTDLSIWSLFAGASPVVKAVMLLLIGASIVSWTYIIKKSLLLKAARSDANEFEGRFWSGIDLVDLFKQVNKHREDERGLASIFEAGFGEFARLRKQGGIGPMDMVEGAQRAMRVAVSRALGGAQQATLSMVAPGIAEALVATAIGLFAAIPAVIAYNRFANDVDRLASRYDTFKDEFTTLLQRQAHT